MSRPRSPDRATLLTVSRGLQVLRAFRSVRAPLTNGELVKRAGLPKATVSRLTHTLLELGVVRHSPGKRAYELNAGRLDFGYAYVGASELLSRAHPFMQELADRLNVSVALAVRDGMDMLYIGYRVSRRVTALRLGVGSVLPMGTTSIGRAYLWGLRPTERRALVRQLAAEAGAESAGLDRSIRASFAELKTDGFCAVSSGFQRATYGVAVPVRIGVARHAMAMSCGRAEARLDLDKERRRIGPPLLTAARELEALLADYDGQP